MHAEQAIQRLREVVCRQHEAISTESTDVFWLRRYMLAIPNYPEGLTSEQKLERFLTELARDQGISALLAGGHSIEQQTPYRAWRDVFQAYSDLDDLAAEAAALEKSLEPVAASTGQLILEASRFAAERYRPAPPVPGAPAPTGAPAR